MKEDNTLSKLGKDNPFKVPEGYFEGFTNELMSKLPEKESVEEFHRTPTQWEKMKPWLYMAAMFVGAALIIRVASSTHSSEVVPLAAEESDSEMEYIHAVVENSMLDDYALYVYLSDAEAE